MHSFLRTRNVLLAVVWVFLLRYVPESVQWPGFAPNRNDLVRAFVPRAAWAMLAPERHDDRAGYDEFWSGYKKVDTDDISVDTDAGTVSVTLELKPEDGEELTRRYTYELIRIDGDLKIAAND